MVELSKAHRKSSIVSGMDEAGDEVASPIESLRAIRSRARATDAPWVSLNSKLEKNNSKARHSSVKFRFLLFVVLFIFFFFI